MRKRIKRKRGKRRRRLWGRRVSGAVARVGGDQGQGWEDGVAGSNLQEPGAMVERDVDGVLLGQLHHQRVHLRRAQRRDLRHVPQRRRHRSRSAAG